MDTLLHLHMTFDTFNDFELVFSKYQNQNKVQYFIKDSRLVANARKRMPKRQLSDKIIYYYVIYNCIHGEYHRSNSRRLSEKISGKRKAIKSFNCPAALRLSASEDGEYLILSSFEEKHCHDCGDSNLTLTHDLKSEQDDKEEHNKGKGEKRKGQSTSWRKSGFKKAKVSPVAMDEPVKVFRDIAKNPSVVRSHLHKTEDNCHTISTVWSQRDLERGENVKFSSTHLVSGGSQVMRIPGASTELKDELICKWSPSRQHKAVIRQVKNKKGDEKQYLEIWNLCRKEQSIDLEASDKHGKVYDDDRFGCLEWSSSEKQLVYVAEKKQPKKTSYFDPKKSDSSSTQDVVKGDEHEFLESWGERLVNRHHPVVCIMDLETQSVKVLEGISEDVSPGQASWAPDDSGIVFVGAWHSPYRLGAHVCFNRRSAVFFANLNTSIVTLLTETDQHIRSVRFSPDKSKFVYLCNAAGGPHWHCSQIAMFDWATKETKVVVNTIMQPTAAQFPGVYCVKLPTNCWAEDNERIFLTTHWRSKEEIISVNTSTRVVTRLTKDPEFGSWEILDIYNGMILATRNSPSTPNHLVLWQVPLEGQETAMSWLCVDSDHVVYEDITWEILAFQQETLKGQLPADVMDYECILVKPSVTGDKKLPLIVFPHGGPHCAMAAEYITSCAFFCKMGFAILMVNYRGSLGFGQAGVLSLLGKVGTQDVMDCHMAAHVVLARGEADADRVVLMGGSHGGFLVTHLIGQFPGFYKACTTRNPVTNIASMLGSTDIPDWCYAEAGLEEFQPDLVPSAKTYEAMLERSPIVHVDKVKTPIMLMIGEDDRRVPPKQGYEYYKAVKARGVETKLHTYPDNNHSLANVDCEGDCLMNMYKWFMKYI